jgi:putative CocE/NonD family hydrolase
VCGLAILLTAPAVQARPSTPVPSWAPQPARFGEGSDFNVGVRMADGTVLRADVFFPTRPGSKAEAPGSFPVLLQQTPYGKEAFDYSAGSSLASTDIPYFVQRGYIVVISDVRGTGDSGGSFGLFDPVQISDGAAMARWAAALPHSDGKVGLFGESYMGIDQFLTVAGLSRGGSNPVKAMFPVITGHDLLTDAVTQGGIPDAEFSAAYLALVTGLNAGSPLLEPLA